MLRARQHTGCRAVVYLAHAKNRRNCDNDRSRRFAFVHAQSAHQLRILTSSSHLREIYFKWGWDDVCERGGGSGIMRSCTLSSPQLVFAHECGSNLISLINQVA